MHMDLYLITFSPNFTIIEWFEFGTCKQISKYLYNIYIAQLNSQYKWCVASRIQFILLSIEAAVMRALDQARNQGQVVFKDGFVQLVVGALRIEQGSASTEELNFKVEVEVHWVLVCYIYCFPKVGDRLPNFKEYFPNIKIMKKLLSENFEKYTIEFLLWWKT